MHVLINFLKNILRIFMKEKFVIILNFHRTDKFNNLNPFHSLHTISITLFKLQIIFLNFFAKCVSPSDISDFDCLSKLNYCITFDDVSSSIYNVKSFLERKKLKYTIAPCVNITENGYGNRDIVYFVNTYFSKRHIFDKVKEVFVENQEIEYNSFSFYKFSKDNRYDLKKIYKEITLPLFENIDEKEKSSLYNSKNYLSWEQIKTDFLNNDLVTIVNHGINHNKMDNFSREEVFNDVTTSTKIFEKKLGFIPKFYSVPFGQPIQNLVVDLNEALLELDYKGVFWVTGSVNKYKHEIKHQLLHLNRIHSPIKFINFLKSLIIGFSKSHLLMKDILIRNSKFNYNNFCLVSLKDKYKLLSFENIVRERKDYASSLIFFNFFFKKNPFKKNEPFYYSSLVNNRIESVGAILYYKLKAGKTIYNASIWSNWRKLKYTSLFGPGLILRQAIKNTSILTGYKSSSDAVKSYKGRNWKKIEVTRYNWSLKNNFLLENKSLKIFDTFNEEITPLLNWFNLQNNFSVYRDSKFYKWRIDKYPLAERKYFAISHNNFITSFCVVLFNKTSVEVTDFVYKKIEDFDSLICSVENYFLNKKCGRIILESNLNEISLLLKSKDDLIKSKFNNFYFLNSKKKDIKNQFNEINDKWGKDTYNYETIISGDVMLRNI